MSARRPAAPSAATGCALALRRALQAGAGGGPGGRRLADHLDAVEAAVDLDLVVALASLLGLLALVAGLRGARRARGS